MIQSYSRLAEKSISTMSIRSRKFYRTLESSFSQENASSLYNRWNAWGIYFAQIWSKSIKQWLKHCVRWVIPQNRHSLKVFFGLRNVYRRFVPHHTKFSQSLNQLLRKWRPVQINELWDACKNEFHFLKDAILSPPILALLGKNLWYSSTRMQLIPKLVLPYFKPRWMELGIHYDFSRGL